MSIILASTWSFQQSEHPSLWYILVNLGMSNLTANLTLATQWYTCIRGDMQIKVLCDTFNISLERKSYQIRKGNPVSLLSLIQISCGKKTSNRLMQRRLTQFSKEGRRMQMKKKCTKRSILHIKHALFYKWTGLKSKGDIRSKRDARLGNISQGVRWPIGQKKVPI